jgi:hypothetical protein
MTRRQWFVLTFAGIVGLLVGPSRAAARAAYYAKAKQRYYEAMAADKVIPFRVADHLCRLDDPKLAPYLQQVREMCRRRHLDPGARR